MTQEKKRPSFPVQIVPHPEPNTTYYLKAQPFPNGHIELVGVQIPRGTKIGGKGGSKRKHVKKDDMDFETLKKSQQRARKNVRHKLLNMSADRMLTLTFRENITDISHAWKLFGKFTRLMKWRYGSRFNYVAVPEFQKRGAVHFHLAINGYYNVNIVRTLWRKAVGDGNIDITSPRKGLGKNSWNPKRIAAYLSKYMSKSDSVLMNKRRFSSRCPDMLPSVTGYLGFGLPVVKYMRLMLHSLSNRPIRDYWESPPDSERKIFIITT